ncbi:MAG: SPASM domain-containing protein [Candidatus Hermodarchaeota archaeon]
MALEKGATNTAIVNFLNGNIYHIRNSIVEKFELRRYDDLIIKEFIDLAKKEELLIKTDELNWTPLNIYDDEIESEISFILEIEEGANINMITAKFNKYKISKICYYGKIHIDSIFPDVKIEMKKMDFRGCVEASKVDGKFERVSQSFYIFNKHFNSCWGRRIAIDKNENVKPCIYSNYKIGNLKIDKTNDIIENAVKLWKITKTQIKKCKQCEFKYVCFDCREIAFRKNNNLYSPNPNCNYDPIRGVFDSKTNNLNKRF